VSSRFLLRTACSHSFTSFIACPPRRARGLRKRPVRNTIGTRAAAVAVFQGREVR
jgi:hypothetical protein